MTVRRLAIGVDGGGSKTRAIVGDAEGHVLGAGRSTSSNAGSVGFEAATAAILAAIEEALVNAAAPAPVAAMALGVAGLDHEDDRARLSAWLQERRIADAHVVVQDTHIVLAAATLGEPWGIALICGTGAVCHGIARSGASIRAGGWGYRLGDEGSGYDLALRALRSATQTADGRKSSRGVLEAALAHWDCRRAEDLFVQVYRPEVTRSVIALFATTIVAMAESGDADARALVAEVATDAAGLLATVGARLGETEPPIALAGGLLSGSAFYRAAVIERAVAAGVSRAALAVVVEDPASGALAMARRLMGA